VRAKTLDRKEKYLQKKVKGGRGDIPR